jgi:hypothetical protein
LCSGVRGVTMINRYETVNFANGNGRTAMAILWMAAAASGVQGQPKIDKQALKTTKEALIAKYKDRFVVVMKEGVEVGLCPQQYATGSVSDAMDKVVMRKSAEMTMVIFGSGSDDVKYDSLNFYNCAREPIHKGEVLKVLNASVVSSALLSLVVTNVSPHNVTRGIGAFAHETLAHGKMRVAIRAGIKSKDLDATGALADEWFKVLDNADAVEAARLGNTAGGAFVNQIKSGMSFAEVESALGVPQTRVDLGDKVLYKYKDMTIEFRDGKVVDVR